MKRYQKDLVDHHIYEELQKEPDSPRPPLPYGWIVKIGLVLMLVALLEDCF